MITGEREQKARRYKPYTEQEDDFILKNYKKMGAEKIAKSLGRTAIGIRCRYKEELNKELIKGARKGIKEDREKQFIAAIIAINKMRVKHDNKVSGAVEAVRAGWLDDIKIKIV